MEDQQQQQEQQQAPEQQWRVRGPVVGRPAGNEEDDGHYQHQQFPLGPFESTSTSSSSGYTNSNLVGGGQERSFHANESSPLLGHDAQQMHDDDDGQQQQQPEEPGPPRSFCRGRPQHHFQYQSITIERRVPLKWGSNVGQHDGDSSGSGGGGDIDGGDGHDSLDNNGGGGHAPGLSTPSTLSESAGAMIIDDQVLDEYDTYLNYYQSQGYPWSSRGNNTGIGMLLPGGAQRPHRHFQLLATITVMITIVFATCLTMLGSLAEKGYQMHHYHQSRGHDSRHHRHGPSNLHLPDGSTDVILSSTGYIYATDFADEATTVSELAEMMLPSWYALSVAQLGIFTETVMPWDVYSSRKILLKTRDLVDTLGPVYQNTTRTHGGKKKKHNKHDDILRMLRKQLNRGYVRVGEFQDLYNAHVLYNIHQLESYRDLVLDWKDEFEAFQERYDVITYLSEPSLDCFDRKDVRSHLFWGEMGTIPCGSDLATRSLAMLGLKQVGRARTYLKHSLEFDSITIEGTHEVYHNLRKELRSIFDEFELFGFVMFATDDPSRTRDAVMRVIKKARKQLGDINDDYTAYTIYAENDEYPKVREELIERIERIEQGWKDFKQWTAEIDFDATLSYLAEDFKRSSEVTSIPLKPFLLHRSSSPTKHLVIGNKAGDADSVISAITLAYIESMKSKVQKTPVVSISKQDLMTQRPEIRLLLELAGISDPSSMLLFVDSPLIESDSVRSDVTLVDHNVLRRHFEEGMGWKVREIVDHHQDEGRYKHKCSGSSRNIAFQDDKALVASTCTLIAEELHGLWEPPFPASIGLLLLGTILLDSVNLSPQVGKVTKRDVDAVELLATNTRWFDLSMHTQSILQINETLTTPDPNVVFNVLQNAKYSESFWSSLLVKDALRYDYKDFALGRSGVSFGVSTVLMPMQSFFAKQKVESRIERFMDGNGAGIHFLAIMFAFQEDGVLHRQLSLCGKDIDETLLTNVTAYLNNPGFEQDSLGLQEVTTPLVGKNMSTSVDYGISIKSYNQTNIAPSRKQIGPMLAYALTKTSSAS